MRGPHLPLLLSDIGEVNVGTVGHAVGFLFPLVRSMAVEAAGYNENRRLLPPPTIEKLLHPREEAFVLGAAFGAFQALGFELFQQIPLLGRQ